MNIVLIIFLIITFGLMFLGFPAAFSMFAGAAYYFIAKGINMNTFIQQVLNGANSYTMLAVPMFILAASVLNGTGTTRKLFSFSEKCVGHIPGGLCHVNILTSVIFAGMSGSAIADTAGIGHMCCKEMRQRGYGDGFSCSLTISTATIGPIIPPSIPMIIYATFSQTNVGALFIGGIIPGILMAVALSAYCVLTAKKRSFPRLEKAPWSDRAKSFLTSVPVLLAPVLLLACIYGGVCTPTEAAVICSLYGIMIGIFVEKELTWSKFLAMCREVGTNVGVTLLVMLAASAFAYVISAENLAKTMISLMATIHLGKLGTFLVMAALLLVLGCFLPQSAIQFAVVPMLIPVASAAGINLVQFGIVAVLIMMMGMCTPPFGTQLFLITGLTGVPMKEITKEIIPQMAVLTAVVVLCIVFEPLTLWLPSTMG